MNDFEKKIKEESGEGLHSLEIRTLQINLGLRCNQRCNHCHLDASPGRTETMSGSTMELVLEAARKVRCRLIDLTGGAPELHPEFLRFVEALCTSGFPVQVRTNLTALLDPLLEGLPEFLRRHGVALVASLPCYLEENVRAQRGEGVYEKSIAVLKRLNGAGYGTDVHLPLDLVYNPGGPFLPPPQEELERHYRHELRYRHGLHFTRLRTITNMPLGRFHRELARSGQISEYFDLLRRSFNPQTLSGLMCRHQISVGWDGRLYDCDFNLALDLPVNHGAPDHIHFFRPAEHGRRLIVTGDHCYGCTAGAGSSCAGALVSSGHDS